MRTKRFPSKLGLFALLFAGAILVFGLFPGWMEKIPLYVTYRHAGDFYERSEAWKGNPDEELLHALLFEYKQPFLSEGRREAGNPFRKLVSEAERSFSVFRSSDPVWLGDRYGYEVSGDFTRFLENPWDDMMLRALYCDVYGFSEHDFRALGSIRTDGGYADTHKILALLFLRENGCFDTEVRNRAIGEGAEIVARAAGEDATWSDLFAERIVFLYWAERGDLVKPEWIRTIAGAQRQDGGWADPLFGEVSNPHSTGLAALAIRYFLDGERDIEFFSPLDRKP